MSARLILDTRLAREWHSLHPMLLDVALALLEAWPAPELVVTSIYRTPEENEAVGAATTVHSQMPHRAMDVRVRNLEEGGAPAALARLLNTRFVYDPSRQALSVAVAKLHGTGPHIHLQVHPRTARA